MKKIIFIVICVMLCAAASNAWPDFSITVTPEDNSSTLNLTYLGAVTSGEERVVTISVKITSDINEGYDVKQRMLDVLRNEAGTELDYGAVVFHTLRGTNSHGSLLLTSEPDSNKLDMLERTLYSSSSGDSDQFTVAYAVLGNNFNASGRFIGRIRYSIVPRGRGTEREVIMNVSLDAEKKDFQAKVETSSQGGNKVRLSTGREEDMEGYIKINLYGMAKKECVGYQSVKQDFKDEQEIRIPLDTVKFSLSAGKGGSSYNALIPLTRDLLIYNSCGGIDEEEVVVNFSIDKDKLADLNNGIFTAELEYKFISSDSEEVVIPIDVELEIVPVFEIEYISKDDRGGVFFRSLSGEKFSEKQFEEKEVLIRVKTNLKKPFYVIHKLGSLLVNNKGDTIPLEFFTMRQEIEDNQPGEVISPQNVPLKLGDMKIFVSDNVGSAAEFKIVYLLKIVPEIRSGDYFTDISYSLFEK